MTFTKKAIAGFVLFGALAVPGIALAATSSADASGDGSGYCTQPGCIQLRTGGPGSNAQAGTGAGSGAFGAFGKDNNFAGGANGYQTGINNSYVAGSRPGDPTPGNTP